MTDYKAEQESEIESLSFLYEEGTEICYLNNTSFKIFVKNERNNASLFLLFEYPSEYPSEPPLVKIVEEVNLNDFVKKNVENKIDQVIQENLGFAMVYSIVESVRTLLTEMKEEKSMHDEMLLNRKGKNKTGEKKSEKYISNHLNKRGKEQENGKEEQNEEYEEYEEYEDEEGFDSSNEEDEEDEENEEGEDKDNDNDSDDEDKTDYQNVLGLKDLCDEKYRVSEEEFNIWRQEFYKDVLKSIHNRNNPDNPTGREIFERGKFTEPDENLLDADVEDDVQWKNEKLFVNIDLDGEIF